MLTVSTTSQKKKIIVEITGKITNKRFMMLMCFFMTVTFHWKNRTLLGWHFLQAYLFLFRLLFSKERDIERKNLKIT